jgi:DNA-binding XRE family transcriptional regulator
MSPKDKPLVWLKGEVKTPPFSKAGRLEAGYLLRQLQKGETLSLPHSRPMATIGPRCHELRVIDEGRCSARRQPKRPSECLRYAEDDLRTTTMRKSKRERLQKKGWKVGTVEEFLGLSPEEAAYIELKLRLSENLRRRRQRSKLTQVELAKRIRSSQSRVAKMEGGDPSVSIDLLVRSLLALGASNRDLARVISSSRSSSAS